MRIIETSSESNSQAKVDELVEALPETAGRSDRIGLVLEMTSTASMAMALAGLWLQQRNGQGPIAWTFFIGSAAVCLINLAVCFWIRGWERRR